MEPTEEIKLLESAFATILENDNFFTLAQWGRRHSMKWSRALKIAGDRTADYKRRREYFDLHNYAELLGV